MTNKIPTLSQEIIANRQEKAPLLKAIMENCQDFHTGLQDVSSALRQLSDLDTPDMEKSQQEIVNLFDELNNLQDRAGIRHNRYKRGLITVSIAGLEKAGKTTFLKSLTGIEFLPAFDERCTAVCCEIHYDTERTDFDIEFYSEEEFMDRVLRPTIETISADLPDAMKSSFQPPSSASEFINLRMPPLSTLPGGTTAFKLLYDLQQLQQNFQECRQNLGKEPLYRRPLRELRDWVAHSSKLRGPDSRQITKPNFQGHKNGTKPDTHKLPDDHDKFRGRHLARIAAVKVCRIYTAFDGGSPHLRWIDTPGVDDPNRRARDLTLSTIASETDLLVVASRPGSNPTPTEGFHNFWDSVSRQPDEVDLLNRLLFVLNCDRRVDADGENIKIHRKYLVDAGVPQHIFVGPYEAIRESNAAAMMGKVNAHLMNNLSDQDDRAVQEFKSRLKNIQARIRLLHDTLAKSHPSDASQQDLENEGFHKWFHWYHDGKDTGFWTDLVEALDRSTRSIMEDARIIESENALNAIFAEEAKQIQTKIPSPKELDDYFIIHRGENPIPNGMRTISTYFSKLINRLSNEVQEFGPMMQDEVVEVLKKAGLEPLLTGKTSREKLGTLLENFSKANSQESAVVEVLRETLELPGNLKYVFRYELRGAVDFCDPTLWNEKEQAWTRLTDMITANSGETERLATLETNKHPPVTGSREQDHEIIKKIAGNAMLGIHSVLNNERYLPRRIADDFMRDCRVRLCFSPESEQEWRSLLFRNRGILLAPTIGKIRDKSERIRAFHTALNNLEASLP